MALGFMRRHRRWLYGFLWIVIAAFIIFYIPAFIRSDAGTDAQTLGRVGGRGGRVISLGEYRRAYRTQLRLYEQMYQGRLDRAMERRLGLPERVFQGLVDSAVLSLEAERLGIKVDQGSVERALLTAPQFQQNGRFIGGKEIRRRYLQGITEEEFLEGWRANLVRQRLETLVTDGLEASPAEVERDYRRQHEQVRVEYVLVDSERFRAQVTPGDSELQDWYKSHRESYRVPEKRVAEYLLLDRSVQEKQVTVTDAEIRTYYDDNSEEFRRPEQVCASHILIRAKSTPEDEQGHADAEARALAEGLAKQARETKDFAALAKKVSEDKGSAPRGGDLGCFPHGQMVPEFDEAAFKLEPEKVSDVVKTSFGYHIIRVASRQEAVTLSLDQVKDRIRFTLTSQKVETDLEKLSREIASDLRRNRSLEQAGAGHGLKPQKSAALARGVADALFPPTASAPLFELKVGQTYKVALAVSRGLAFVALAEIKPSYVPELKEAQEAVRRDVVESKAAERARELAAELRTKALREGLEKAAQAASLTRKETPALVGRGQTLGELGSGAQLEDAVFALAEKTLSEPVRVAAGYAVVGLLEKKPFDPAAFEKEKATLSATLRDSKRRQFFESYLAQAARRFTVERTEAFQGVASE
jgi:peptidyl-prolyl cis-trans isomerase D